MSGDVEVTGVPGFNIVACAGGALLICGAEERLCEGYH